MVYLDKIFGNKSVTTIVGRQRCNGDILTVTVRGGIF